jgi:hypothetical protein
MQVLQKTDFNIYNYTYNHITEITIYVYICIYTVVDFFIEPVTTDVEHTFVSV